MRMSSLVSPIVARRILILMPVRDDWESAAALIQLLDKSVSQGTDNVEILLVDDGSVQQCHLPELIGYFNSVRSIQVLRLRRNLGHDKPLAREDSPAPPQVMTVGNTRQEPSMACKVALCFPHEL